MSRLRENVACANGEGRLAQRAGLHDNNLDTVGEPEWALIYGKSSMIYFLQFTELRKSLRTWFGEVCSCCCLSLLPKLA